MHHIRCEIRNATVWDEKKNAYISAVDYLADKQYAAQITLSLKVEDTGGLAPNLAYVTNRAMFSYLLDGNLSLDRQQTYSTSYVLDMKSLRDKPEKVDASCSDDKNNNEDLAHSLSGDLGIGKVIYGGQKEIADTEYNLTITPGVFATQPTPLPNFGSTIQFMITKGFDTGPYWKIFNFTGPSTSSKGMISGSRITTDNVIIAFASVPPPKKSEAEKKLADEIEKLLKDRDDAKNRLADQKFVPLTRGQILSLQRTVQQTSASADIKQRQLDAIEAAQPSPAFNATALQGFTTNIILQNLAGSLAPATH